MSLATRFASSFLFAAVLTSCSAVNVPGESKADATLKETVADQIKQWELAYGCSTLWLTVTDTKVTIPFDGKRSQEKWTIKSCNGELHDYEVNYAPSPQGGTDVGIRKWPE